MKNLLSRLNKKSLALVRSAGRLAQERGAAAYLVGGPVRDLLLKRLVKDLDIVVEGDAVAIARAFAQAHKGRWVPYAVFKTATVFLPDGTAVDFATCRKEVYPHYGDLPVITPSSIKDDLFRRDFTVNAMAVAIGRPLWGELTDPYGGFKDLKAKKIRVLHEKSFLDDPTRILRAVRFEQRLGFRLETKTLKLLRQALAKKMPNRVKAPRYFEEFKKILSEPKADIYLHRLSALGGLYIHALAIQREFPVFKKLVAVRKAIAAYQRKGITDFEPWVVYMIALQDESREDDLAFALQYLGLSRKHKEKIMSPLFFSGILAKLSLASVKASQAYALLKGCSLEALVFLRASAGTRARARIDHYVAKDRWTSLAVNGEDLKKIGLSAGRPMKQILEHLLAEKIDGQFKNKQQELQRARTLAGSVKRGHHAH